MYNIYLTSLPIIQNPCFLWCFLLLLVYIGKLVSINVVCGVVIIMICQVNKRYFGNFKTNLLYGGKFCP